MTPGTMLDERGFSLVELVVAAAIMVTVTSAIFAVMNPASGVFQTQPEVVDMQQRVRVATDTLTRDLMMVGAGAYSGSQSGSLVGFFAPIQPSRQGSLAAYDDGPGVFRPDALTIFYVPTTFSQTTLAAPMSASSAQLRVNDEPGCPSGQDLCGFKEGMQVLIYDDSGSYDTTTLTQVQDNAGYLQHNRQGPLSKSYDVNAKVVAIDEHVYFLDAAARQLIHYDGFQTAAPVLDNVAGLNFDYYGEPQPPQFVQPMVLPDMTYGPRAVSSAATQAPWPAGENCTVTVVANRQVPRLDTLGPPASRLVKLTPAQLTDGPWCPDAINPNRFDADLLRVRKIRVSIWLTPPAASLRAPLMPGPGVDALFTLARTGVRANTLPDQIIRFDVTPRNLNLAR